MGTSVLIPVILLIVLLVFGVFFMVSISKQNSSTKDSKNLQSDNNKKNVKNESQKTEVMKEDVFKFMEFDRILDSMIVQNNGQKYTMVIKCKGINYDLMSENEQLAVEEGFITFLNTLRFPIQLYVQAQNIDLKKTISKYNENLQGILTEYDQITNEYNQTINSLDATKEDIKKAEYNKKSVQNVLEYATDIVKYVERLSVNKSLLQRSFYIIFSYYTSEITSISNFSKDEIVNICYNELYTRGASIIGALASCSVSGSILSSNELANLLYTSYNRDDAKYIDIQRALESGYYRLYTTSEDAFKKREALLEEQINNEAQIRAYESIKEAIQKGEYQTPETQQLEINQEISKAAIDIIRNENIDDELKENAKDIVIEKYKKEKQEILNGIVNSKEEKKEIKQDQATELEKKDELKETNNIEEEKEKIGKEEINSKEELTNSQEKINIIETNNEVQKENENIIENQIQDSKNEETSELNEEIKNSDNKIVENNKEYEQKDDTENITKNNNENNNENNNDTSNNDSSNTTTETNDNNDFEDDFFDSII